MEPLDRSCLGLSFLAACFVGFVELHTTEVSATLATILVTGTLLGFARPRLFWVWALPLGGAVPFAYAVAVLLAITPASWPQPGGLLCYVGIDLVTLGVAMLACGSGALVSNSAQNAR